MVKPAVLLLTTMLASAVHPLHTSYTEIARDAKTGFVSISVKLFADDFGAAIDSLAVATGVKVDVAARTYFDRSVSLAEENGTPVRLAWCGVRTADGFTWLCARSVTPAPERRLRFRNALMFDRFPDQISIVRFGSPAGARTMVLTRGSPELGLD